MESLKLKVANVIQRLIPTSNADDAELDRTVREIKGTIFAILTLFQLFAFTSYLPFDRAVMLQGRLDLVGNMGGIVGAIIAELCLGGFGIAGYGLTLLTTWFTIKAYRGYSLREEKIKALGILLASLFLAILLRVLFADKFAAPTLLHGGYIGITAGDWLMSYLHTAGALILILGGLFITLTMSTRLSFSTLFDREEDYTEAEEPKAIVSPAAPEKRRGLIKSTVVVPQAAPKKRTRKPKAAPVAPDAEATNVDPLAAEPDTALIDLTTVPPTDYEFKELIPFSGSYGVPSTRLLKNSQGYAAKLSRGEIKTNADKLTQHLLSFQITGEITHASQGPVLVTYEYKPSPGMKLAKIANVQDDLGVVLGTRELRVIAPIPGKTVVGIEVPRPEKETIALKDILNEKEFQNKKLKIPFAIGKATDGTPVIGDVTAMPHLLVAGATGSGKSVFINSLLMSFLFRMTPQQLRLILIDPKMLEMSVFKGIPHLITDVVTDPLVALTALNWSVDEMERRYKLMAETNSKNIESFNEKQRSADKKLPYIVIVVDELADLMLTAGKQVEVSITRLAQKARAAGIHLVIATQRPSTDVVTGLIKANIPSRISFKVPSGIDSRTVLDSSGAEELIGKGDCLMIQPGIPLRRLHGCFVSEDELVRAVKNVINGKDHTKNFIEFPRAKLDE